MAASEELVEVFINSGEFKAYPTTINQDRQADEILKANHIVHIGVHDRISPDGRMKISALCLQSSHSKEAPHCLKFVTAPKLPTGL
jgi:hypothetical protein